MGTMLSLPGCTLPSSDVADTLHSSAESWWHSGLHANLDSFERAETNIRDQLSRGRGRQEQSCLVLGSILLSSQGSVQMLEIFVEAILAGTLYRVADECWAPTSKDSSESLASIDLAPGLYIAFVQVRVDLSSALDEIEGSYGCVSGALVTVSYILTDIVWSLTHAKIPPTTHAA